MLAQEPWCYDPARIGRLTDWQIERLYAGPAAERAKEATGGPPKSPGARRDAAAAAEPGTTEHRAQIVGALMGTFGMSRARAETQYEKQLQQWRDSQGKG